MNEASQKPNAVEILDLSETGLTSFPEQIKNFKQLKTLILYDNDISYIPSWIKNMTNLTNIYLGGNNEIDSLTNLAPMIWIEGIDLSNIGLKEIPTFIFDFKKLDYLKITENKITKLPSSLNKLQALKVLNLSYNKIKKFPDYLSLPNLEQLFLHSNPVKSIPASISKMTSLVELYIGSSKIKSLPDELFEINTIGHIDVTNTKIKSDKLSELKNKNTKIYWD